MEFLIGLLIVAVFFILLIWVARTPVDISKEDYQKLNGELSQRISETQSELDNLMAQLSAAKNEYEDYLIIIQRLAAAEQAIINHNKTRDVKSFERLNFSAKEKMDLALLKEVKDKLHNREALAKAMYDVYYKKGIKEIAAHITQGRTVSGIYKIVNNITNRVYIGHSVDVASRIETHAKRGVGSIAPTASPLYKDMWKYGVENFSFFLIEEVKDDAERRAREKFWIEYYGGMDYGYNDRVG